MTDTPIRARDAGFLRDITAIAGRAVRAIPKEPEMWVPALIIPIFFLVVNVGSLQTLAEDSMPGLDFKAFQLPVAVIFAVTGISRASALVLDIQNGYFDRLTITPVSRVALLLGLMVADLALVMVLTIPVIVLGLLIGVEFATGILGMLAFVLVAGLWALAFAGFPYAIALKTGNPAAVNSSFLLFFPFAFLTTAFLPQEALTGWLSTMADYNPVTYLLDALRAIIVSDWDWSTIGSGLIAVAGVALVSMTMALKSLHGRLEPD